MNVAEQKLSARTADPDMQLEIARWFEELLPSGISVWLEDWSAVANFVEKVRASGESPEAFCASHRAECQALHKKVLITDVNDATLKMMRTQQKSQLLGPMSEVLPYSIFTFPRWIAALARGDDAYRGQTAVERRDGELCECLIAAALPSDLSGLSRIAVLVIDVGEYRGRSGAGILSAIQHSSRLAAIGALTASIAHEVKSPLAAILTNAAAARRWLSKPEPDLKEAEQAIDGLAEDARRVREIIDRTLSFLKPTAPGRSDLDVLRVVDDVIMMMVADLQRETVEIAFRPEDNLPRVLADAIQVQQVLINLVQNATQALQQISGSRTIMIHASVRDQNVLIEVADNGPGMSPDQFGRLFEPFYSTKSAGIGMGLGGGQSVH